MKRLVLCLLLALTFPAVSRAHFLWLLTDVQDGTGKVQIFFSEEASPDDPDLLDKVTGAEVWSLSGRGEPKLISPFTKTDEALEAELTGAALQSPVILRCNYGVMSRGGAPFMLNYYAKTYPSVLPGGWRAVKDAARLPLEVTPSSAGAETRFRVTWNGQPQAGVLVTVTGPGIGSKLEGPTDEAGDFKCPLTKAGVFSIRAKHTEETAGKFNDQEYASVRHYSTLTLHYAPAQLTPVANNLPTLPKGVTSFGGAVVGDTLFVYGGNYGSAHEYASEDQSGDLWKLDLKKPGAWEQSVGGPKLQGLALVAHKGKLYRVGGFTAMNKAGEDQDLRSQADFARLDPSGTAWESLPSLPEPRSSHDAAVIGDTLYVVGGWNMQGGGGTAKWQDTALAFDLSDPQAQWKTLAAPAFQRRALALAGWQGRLYCLGGMQQEGGATTAVAVYDPAANSWAAGPALLGGPMDGFGASAFSQGALYATTISGSIQRLSGDGAHWEYLGQLEHPRFFHRLLPWGDNQLVVVGGASMEEGKAEALEILALDNLKTAAKQ